SQLRKFWGMTGWSRTGRTSRVFMRQPHAKAQAIDSVGWTEADPVDAAHSAPVSDAPSADAAPAEYRAAVPSYSPEKDLDLGGRSASLPWSRLRAPSRSVRCLAPKHRPPGRR